MTLTIIEFGGEPQHIECESFEFRSNQVANWIMLKLQDGSTKMIQNVCVIKVDSEEPNHSDKVIESSEHKPCEDAISRAEVLKKDMELPSTRDENCLHRDVCEEMYGKNGHFGRVECPGLEKCIEPYNSFCDGLGEDN